MIKDYFVLPYRLSFSRPWISHHGEYRYRKGFLVELEDIQGNRGVGDAAPLPEMGTETLHQCHERLLEWGKIAPHYTPEELLTLLDDDREKTPALCSGIESAIVDLLSKQQQMPLHRWLNPDSTNQVKLNQVTSLKHPEITTEGGPVIKLKLGVAPIEQELEQLTRWVKTLPSHYRLRLDANQAWHYAEAEWLLSQLEGLPIDSLEEPIRSPTLKQLEALQQQCAFPIAVDESLHTIGFEAVQQSPLRRVILKPTLTGGPWTTYQQARQLQQHGIEVVITSMLESAIGTLTAAHCAAAIDPLQKMAHGLSTFRCFSDDLAVAPEIKHGILLLP